MSKKLQPMNPAVKSEWVKDLTSGKFPQTQGMLCRETPTDAAIDILNTPIGYCCLGVLVETKARLQKKKAWTKENKNAGMPDDSTTKWAGLSSEVVGKLIKMNDTKKKSFKAIASWINRYL